MHMELQAESGGNTQDEDGAMGEVSACDGLGGGSYERIKFGPQVQD